MSDEQQFGRDELQGVPIWPGTVNTEGLLPPLQFSSELQSSTPLTFAQDARVSALYHARTALEVRGGAMGGPNQSRPPQVGDLLAVARWIMDGDDGDQDR